jgi:hypothetical protein
MHLRPANPTFTQTMKAGGQNFTDQWTGGSNVPASRK